MGTVIVRIRSSCSTFLNTAYKAFKQYVGIRMKYAFEIKTLVMVEAESEEEAWDNLPATAREALCDFDYERSPEDDKEE